MTALNRLHISALTGATSVSRKDLLGVSQDPGLAPMPVDTSRKWLENLGFDVSQILPEHWIVTHSKNLPELHLYSIAELSQFAAHRAHHYADRFARENS